jgi:hypothetical protein
MFLRSHHGREIVALTVVQSAGYFRHVGSPIDNILFISFNIFSKYFISV